MSGTEAEAARRGEHSRGDTAWRLGSAAIWCALLVVVLVVIARVGVMSSQHFLSFENVRMVLREWTVLLLLVPVMVIIVASGGIDLSVGAVAGFAGVLIARLSPETSVASALSIAVSAAVVIGAVNGLLVGLAGVHSAIATLGTAVLIRGLLPVLGNGQMMTLRGEPPAWLTSPWVAAALATLVVAVVVVLTYVTPFGRRADAHGSAASRAFFVGLPYVLSSLMAALYGAILLGRIRGVGPAGCSGLELKVILAAVAGGTVFARGLGNPLGGALAALAVACAVNAGIVSGLSYGGTMAMLGGALLAFALLGVLYLRVCDGMSRAWTREAGGARGGVG